MKRILHLGCGTQSSVLLLMSERGELPPLDFAIFADTQWEPKAVYDQLEWLKSECKNTPIVTVTAGNIFDDAKRSKIHKKDYQRIDGGRWASMPMFVKTPRGRGMIKRQCTSEYKINPINRYIKEEVLGLARRGRWPKECVVEKVFGISLDEAHRMRDPDGKWCRNNYPLIQMRWRRQAAIDWAEKHYPGRTFPRSACIGCPFHSDAEWRSLKNNSPDEWEEAVELDRAIRDADGMSGQVFLHSSLVPLEDVDLRRPDEKNGQGRLWDDECHGICGV